MVPQLKPSFCKPKIYKPRFKKEVVSQVFKLQKDYSFNYTKVLETTKFIVSKHPTTFENQSIFENHSISPIYIENTLYPNRALVY
jgi:hypothetical protein